MKLISHCSVNYILAGLGTLNRFIAGDSSQQGTYTSTTSATKRAERHNVDLLEEGDDEEENENEQNIPRKQSPRLQLSDSHEVPPGRDEDEPVEYGEEEDEENHDEEGDEDQMIGGSTHNLI